MVKKGLSMYTKATTDSDVDDYYKKSMASIIKIETKIKVNLAKLKGRMFLVYIMHLNNILKMSLLDRLYDCNLGQYSMKELIEWVKDGDDINDLVGLENDELICELDACLEYYEYKTGESWQDSNNNERQDVESVVTDAFSELNGRCKYTIMTEDYNILFQPKGGK